MASEGTMDALLDRSGDAAYRRMVAAINDLAADLDGLVNSAEPRAPLALHDASWAVSRAGVAVREAQAESVAIPGGRTAEAAVSKADEDASLAESLIQAVFQTGLLIQQALDRDPSPTVEVGLRRATAALDDLVGRLRTEVPAPVGEVVDLRNTASEP